ncbi:hypothetical protein [Aestuariivirga sp.]|jgi:hypothetical protein
MIAPLVVAETLKKMDAGKAVTVSSRTNFCCGFRDMRCLRCHVK